MDNQELYQIFAYIDEMNESKRDIIFATIQTTISWLKNNNYMLLYASEIYMYARVYSIKLDSIKDPTCKL